MKAIEHLVKLSNGQTVMLIEGSDGLSIAWSDENELEAYICKINADGVQVYPNSGEATLLLTENLGLDWKLATESKE